MYFNMLKNTQKNTLARNTSIWEEEWSGEVVRGELLQFILDNFVFFPTKIN